MSGQGQEDRQTKSLSRSTKEMERERELWRPRHIGWTKSTYGSLMAELLLGLVPFILLW